MKAVTIPVMAKCRIGHFVEAADPAGPRSRLYRRERSAHARRRENHVDKHDFNIPFVCGARNLGEALRRIAEGAAMIRTKGEAGTGDVVEAVRHMRTIIRRSDKSRAPARTSSTSWPRTTRHRSS